MSTVLKSGSPNVVDPVLACTGICLHQGERDSTAKIVACPRHGGMRVGRAALYGHGMEVTAVAYPGILFGGGFNKFS